MQHLINIFLEKMGGLPLVAALFSFHISLKETIFKWRKALELLK